MPKILIADDSIAVRKVAERLLTEAGMGVTLAANGSEALAILNRDRPDLIVSDVIMPDKSGYEVCAFIRAQANLADIPVLLISGIVNDEVSRQAESCKADGVLKKPFQGTSLKDRVLDLLTKRQSKPARVPEPVPSQAAVEPPVGEAHSVAPMAASPEVIEQIPDENTEFRRQTEPATISPPEPGPMPLMPGRVVEPAPILQVHAPGESAQARDQHLAVLSQRDARIAELEEQLELERRQSQEHVQKIQRSMDEQREQAEGLSSRAEALQQSLSEERAQRTALTEQLDAVSRQAHRVDELERALAEERRQVEQLSEQVSQGVQQAARIVELEAHLTAERGAASQLVQQITALEHVEGRARELETALKGAHEEAEHHQKACAELETLAAKVPLLEEGLTQAREQITELEGALTAEREAAATLLAQVKELEETARRVKELDLALTAEREHSAQLMQRANEAEQRAEQSTRRFEDMARKLGEIAGLASQLGNGKR
jgi:CheY-like chemotaxis protein